LFCNLAPCNCKPTHWTHWGILGRWEDDHFSGWLTDPKSATFTINRRDDKKAYVFGSQWEAENYAEMLRYMLRKDDCKIEVKPLR
jgi:hypothetical protein